jgi:nicotinate-nucleotide adenylyltransferase
VTLKKIGIMGGTFDPIHYGHLAAANEILYKLKLEKIYFIPAKQNPFKKQATKNIHRLKMTKLACETNPNFETLNIDIKRPGKITKTFDTLTEIKIMYPDAKLYFIVGVDSLKQIDKWYKVSEIIKLSTIIGISRPNFSVNIIKNINNDYNITFIDIPAMEISSSNLRKRIKNKIPIGYLTPREIIKYIYKNNLYK